MSFDLTIGSSNNGILAANHPDDPSNPRGNCFEERRNDHGFILKLIQHAKIVAVNICAELIRYDDIPSDDKEDYDRAAPQWLLRDIARAKDAQFSRGRRLKSDCIDKLDAAVSMMMDLAPRALKPEKRPSESIITIRNRINKIISGCITRGMSSEAITDEVWEYLELSSEYSEDVK